MSTSSLPQTGEKPRVREWPLRDYAHVLFTMGSIVLLFLFITLSFVASQFVQGSMDQQAASRFEREVQSVQRRIQERLTAYHHTLYSAQGLFSASDEVNRSEWRSFVESLQLSRRFPGLTGLAYLPRVTSGELSDYIRTVQRDTSITGMGYPDFEVHPEGERDVSYIVTYVEPFSGNEDLLGLDASAYQMPTLERIGETGELTSVGRFDLGKPEAEYVFLMPLYRQSIALQTVRDRRAALRGFVAAAVNPQAFLGTILSEEQTAGERYTLEIIDGSDTLLRSSFPSGRMDIGEDEEVITVDLPIQTAGLTWTIRGQAPTAFGLETGELKLPQLVFLGGFGFSWLLFTVLYLFTHSRRNALRIAQRMTGELGKFQLAVRNAANHIIITDPTGVIVYANPAVMRTTGYSPEELIGKTPRLWGGRMNVDFYDQMWKTIKDRKEIFTGEVVNRRKTGDEYDASISIAPILDHQGVLYGFVGIEEDITDRKRLDKAKSEFVSLASHQLRTPLTAMRLTLETILSDTELHLDIRHTELLQHALEYGIRMADIIHSMLTVSHIEAGRVSLVLSDINFCEFLREVIAEQGPVAAIKKVGVSLDCSGGITLRSDAKLLREIVANLLSNSIKYSEPEGKVKIRVSSTEDFVSISVSDDGYGIPARDQNRVFQKFFRGENIVHKSTDGTGLGLYLVHSLTTLLGGNVAFQSEENHGTTFTVLLPLTPPADGKEEDSHR
jgi:PAS domain S-box-containing protein